MPSLELARKPVHRVEGTALKWRKSLFAFLTRNALPATHFFNIPSDRVVEIGMQIQC